VKSRLDARWLRTINVGSRLIIGGFGCVSLATLFVR
jgi:hypothetical protein